MTSHVDLARRTFADEQIHELVRSPATSDGVGRVTLELLDGTGVGGPAGPTRQALLRSGIVLTASNVDPGLIVDLRRHVSAWLTANGLTESAIGHAQVAGDADEVAQLVLETLNPAWADGHVATVGPWLEWLSEHPPTQFSAAVAAHGALITALLGQSRASERWAAVAERQTALGVLPDGSTETATVAYMRAILARHGPEASRRDAIAALAGLSPVSPYRSDMMLTIGLADLIEDDLDGAEAAFAEAHELAFAAGQTPAVSMIQAERHLVAWAKGDRIKADKYVAAAVDTLLAGKYDGYWNSALTFAAAARSSARQGRTDQARDYLRRAERLRPLLSHRLPVVSVQALLTLGHAYLDLANPAGARATAQQAQKILLRQPDLGTIEAAAADLRSRLGQFNEPSAVGAASLTRAELRLLPLLQTHLSFPQIAEQLSVSRHTIKTQAASLYRKLGVTSRHEAVKRLVQLRIGGETPHDTIDALPLGPRRRAS